LVGDLSEDELLEDRPGGVEQAPLGHQAEDAWRASLDLRAVAEPAASPCGPVLDHRLDGERQLPHRTHREPTTAGLVPRETGFVPM
jgi:hypothetical protein